MKLKSMSVLLTACVSMISGAHAVAEEVIGPALKKGQEYMILTNYPNNLHVIDVESDSLYKTCTMPDAFGPGMAIVAPDGKTAYVLNNHYADIYGIELDTCKTTFHADLEVRPGEWARSIFSLAISPDGKEIYSVANPTIRNTDHYVVQEPRLQVYSTDAGLDAEPARMFPVPRQISIMQTGNDGALYMAGADIYKLDVQTGEYEVAVPLRNWDRPLYSAPDVLYLWPHQSQMNDFAVLYTAAKFEDETQDLATAEYVYGFVSIDLETGKSQVEDFATLTEIYFTGMRSPKEPNHMFAVLNNLAKYDVEQKEKLQSASLEHTYYAVTFNASGEKLYLAGTWNDVAIFDPDNLERLGTIEIPGGDMAITTPQIFTR